MDNLLATLKARAIRLRSQIMRLITGETGPVRALVKDVRALEAQARGWFIAQALILLRTAPPSAPVPSQHPARTPSNPACTKRDARRARAAAKPPGPSDFGFRLFPAVSGAASGGQAAGRGARSEVPPDLSKLLRLVRLQRRMETLSRALEHSDLVIAFAARRLAPSASEAPDEAATAAARLIDPHTDDNFASARTPPLGGSGRRSLPLPDS